MTDEYSDIQSAVRHLLEKCDGILTIREFVIQDVSLRDKNSYSSEDINILVRQMANHIGLQKSHFLIELGKINDSVSGRIHLQERLGFTKIQIDSDLVRHPETLLMVLSHELTHKYLHEHAAEYEDTNANEELTDIASVFLGFGKYILNGKHYSENSDRGVRNVTVGYLTDSAFAIAYDVSCFQRGLTEDAVLDGLSGGALKCLWDVRINYRDKYPERILQIRKAQADLQYIKMTLDNCKVICPYKAKDEIDKLGQWHKHLQAQFRDVVASTVPDVLRKYIENLNTCNENVLKLLDSAQHTPKVEGVRKYSDVDAMIAKLKIIHGMSQKPFERGKQSGKIIKHSQLVARVKNWFCSLFSFAQVVKHKKIKVDNAPQSHDETTKARASCDKRSDDEAHLFMSIFDYQIGQSFADRTRWTRKCGFGNHEYRELGNLKLKSKLFDFDRYSLHITPSSWKIFAIELTRLYETREEADTMKNKIQAWLVERFSDRTTDCLGVRSWWMGSEECGTYLTLGCSDVKWGNFASRCIRLTINNVDATNELVAENNKLIEEGMKKSVILLSEMRERCREELENAAEGKYQIVKDITPAALWYGHVQGFGSLNFMSNEIYRVSVKLKPEVYKRIESGEIRWFRMKKSSDWGTRLAISNQRRIGAVIFVSGTVTFPREVMCWQVTELLDLGDTYLLGLGLRVK